MACSYAGTSVHSMYKCMLEHAHLVIRGDEVSALSKHRKIKHPNIDAKTLDDVKELFEGKVVKSNIKFYTNRYIHKAIEIEKIRNDPYVILMNAKSEWGNDRARRLKMADSF